jgi:hypothetical protein
VTIRQYAAPAGMRLGGWLTLSKDEVVGLDEVVEGVLLQLDDVRSGGNCRRSEQAERVLGGLMHFDFPIRSRARESAAGLRKRLGFGCTGAVECVRERDAV